MTRSTHTPPVIITLLRRTLLNSYNTDSQHFILNIMQHQELDKRLQYLSAIRGSH